MIVTLGAQRRKRRKPNLHLALDAAAAALDSNPFPCTVCGKTFRVKGYLSQHVKIHTGEARKVCPICNKVCASRGSLYDHKRRIHPDLFG